MKGKKGNGNASLVCGLLSLIAVFMPYFGLPLGILAIIFGNKSNKLNEKTGNASAGIILGIIGTIINAIMLVIVLIFVAISSAL
jgi:hypothetical protein